MTTLPPSPFLGSPGRLDVEAFMLDVEPLPQFLQAPVDVLHVLAGYAR